MLLVVIVMVMIDSVIMAALVIYLYSYIIFKIIYTKSKFVFFAVFLPFFSYYINI